MSQLLPQDRRSLLLLRLLDQTKAGKVTWEDLGNTSSIDMYRARVGAGFIRIGRDQDHSSDGVEVTILNENGLMVSEFELSPIAQDFALGKELLEWARIASRGGESVVEDMLEALGK